MYKTMLSNPNHPTPDSTRGYKPCLKLGGLQGQDHPEGELLHTLDYGHEPTALEIVEDLKS